MSRPNPLGPARPSPRWHRPRRPLIDFLLLSNAAGLSAARARGDRGPSPTVAAFIESARGAERVGQRELARAHYEKALRSLSSGDELPTATTILRWIAGTHFADANHAAAEDCVAAAIATAEAWNDDIAVGYAINMLGMFRWQQGELDEAVRLYNDARDRAVRTGDARLAAITAQNLGVIANIRGDFTRALQFYQASLTDYRAMGLQRDVCVALNNLGMVYTDTEQWDEAELSYREAIELVRDLGEVALRVQIEVNVVEMWVARGNIPRARDAADAAMALAAEIGDAHVPGDAYRLIGVIARESGDLTNAESMLQRAAEIASARQDLLLLAETSREQAEVHRRQGRNRETLQSLNRAHQLFTQLRARRDLADVDRQTTHLEGEFIDVVRRWGESIEAKDRYTQGHCERVADLSCALAARSGFDERTLFWFRIGALLHDVGKLIIPAEVLNKPAKLSDEEWALIRRHPEAGVELLAGIEFPWDVRPLIESHHERWDGRGYPHGLAGEAIPFTARILCLADVFDALTSQRSYKQSMSVADALEIMRRDVGRAFDPALFEVFEKVVLERDASSGADAATSGTVPNAAPRRASRDDLTQLPLRRACTAASTRLLAARRRDGTAASLLYLKVTGLDEMKQQLGQARADDVLATVAGVLRRASRRGDVLARFGADDFVLLLGEARTEHALAVAGRVRAQLTDGFAGSTDVGPIAIGVATAPEHGDSLDALVAAARLAVQTNPEHAGRSLAMADRVAEPPRPAIERFVGRVAETRRLEQMLDASMRGDPRIVTVVGAAGVGKTSLVSRLMLDARRRGAAYVVGNCRPSVFQTPYAPWVAIIEGLRAARVIPERRWHSLPRLVPSLAGTQRSLRLADAGATETRSVAHEICELLASAAASRPLVVVLEDAEHADHASWEVVDQLAAHLSDRVMVCLTVDESYRASARARLRNSQHHYELRLEGLAPDEIAQWLGDLFADRATANACASHLAVTGQVSPLWSVHAVHGLVDGGQLVFAGGAWRAADAAALSTSTSPATVAGVIARRLDALTPKTRAILGELALLGDEFELDVALASGIGDEAELLDAIDEAAAAAILREDGAEPGAAFAFTHRAVALAARETIGAMRLRRVHERIARGFEQVRPVALFDIAAHFDLAGLAERAFEYALLAAARAASVDAYADASAAYERARAHVTTPAQRTRLDDLFAQLPVRSRRTGVA